MTFSPLITAKYDVTILSSSILSLVLRRGERWVNGPIENLATFCLTSISVGGISKWDIIKARNDALVREINLAEQRRKRRSDALARGISLEATISTSRLNDLSWQILPTPTVQRGDDRIIYMSTPSFSIEGTGFMTAAMTKLVFDPPLVRDVDYVLHHDCERTTKSGEQRRGACLQLMLIRGKHWRSDLKPGPLKLTHLDTGGGTLRVDAENGGVTVAEVRANALAEPNLLADRVSSISALEQNGEILRYLALYSHSATIRAEREEDHLLIPHSYGAFPDFKVFVVNY